jgi:hypothetical protein
MAKAEAIREKLISLNGGDQKRTKDEPSLPGDNTIARLPAARIANDNGESKGDRDRLRQEIRDLAVRTIDNDPLNARAFRLLAEVSKGPDRVRVLMLEGLDRSRHEAIAALWLLNDSFLRDDFDAALRYSDILLRTQPALADPVLHYLSLIAEKPGGRELLVEQLARGPVWRQQFFEALPRNAKNADTPLTLITALHDAIKPVTNKELAPYLNFLVASNRVDLAYNAWLQFLTKSEIEHVGLLTNASLETPPGILPFDWKIAKGLNAMAEFVAVEGEGRLMHIRLDEGRIEFPEISQIVLLAPGRYRFEGKLRGALAGKRGLRWQLRCTSGSQRVLAETEMLLGQSREWRVFTLEAQAPRLEECRAQTLRLFHDSRSASEQLLSGEIWFSDLRLERLSESQ